MSRVDDDYDGPLMTVEQILDEARQERSHRASVHECAAIIRELLPFLAAPRDELVRALGIREAAFQLEVDQTLLTHLVDTQGEDALAERLGADYIPRFSTVPQYFNDDVEPETDDDLGV